MPRAARVLIDGGIYHVMSRGNNGQSVFRADYDFERYLSLLKGQLWPRGLTVFHYALVPNETHIILRTERGPLLSKAMLSLNLAYSLYYRKRYEYSGHLWQGRFHSTLIPGVAALLEHGCQLETTPIRLGLVDRAGDYAWTSYHVYAQGAQSALVDLNRHASYMDLGTSMAEREERYRTHAAAALIRSAVRATDLLPRDTKPLLLKASGASRLPVTDTTLRPA